MGILELKTDAEFEEAIKTDKYCIVMFTAAWCGPCKKVYPVFDELNESMPAIRHYTVDVDRLAECTARNQVTVMPTFQVWAKSQPVYVTEGANEANLRSLHQKVCERVNTGT